MSDASQLQPEPQPAGRSRRLRVAAIAAGAAILIAVVIHLPAFRATVLRFALRTIETKFGLHAEVRELDYDLVALRVRLSGIKVARAASVPPFFEANGVSVTLPFRILFGTLGLDSVAIDQGRARIIINRDGTTNLPASTTGQAGEPAALPVGSVDAPRFGLELRDEAHDVQLQVPGVSLHVERDRGRIALDAPAQLTAGTVKTSIARLDGDVRFDGRDVALRGLQLETADARLSTDGTIAVLRPTPSLKVDATGAIDVAGVARLLGLAEPPAGKIALTANASGPFSDVAADVRVTSDSIEWRRARLEETDLHARLTSDRIVLDSASAAIAGGRLRATGFVPRNLQGEATLDASWSDIDSTALVDAFVATSVKPAGTISGDARGHGPLDDIRAWILDARATVGSAATGRGRISLPGETTFKVRGRAWNLNARHRLANVAPIYAGLAGPLGSTALETWPVDGSVVVGGTEIASLLHVARQLGIDVPEDLVSKGNVTVGGLVSGRLASPTYRFDGSVASVVIRDQTIANVMLKGTADLSAVHIDRIAGSQRADGGGPIGGTADYNLGTNAYRADVKLSDWRVAPTEDLPVGGRADLSFSGSGRGADIRGTGDVSLRDVEARGIRIGDLTARLQLAGNQAHVDTRVPEFDLSASADVNLAAPYAAKLSATAPRLDLARALADIHTPTPVTGSAAIRLDAETPLAMWRDGSAEVRIDSLDARAGGLAARLSAPAIAHYRQQRVTLDRLDAEIGATHVAATGSLPAFANSPGTTSDAIAATATGDLGEVLEAVRASGLLQAPVERAEGPFALLARATGSLEAPVLAADLELGPGSVTVRPDLPPIADIKLRARLQDDQIVVRDAAAMYQGAALSADAQVPVALLTGSSGTGGAASLHARATGFTPAALRPFVDETTLEQLGGQVDASVDLTSTSTDLASVQGEARLDRFEVSLAGLRVTQRVPTRINVGNGFAQIAAWQWQGDGGDLTVSGQVRLEDRQAAVLANGNLDLRILTPFVRSFGLTTSGRLEPRLSVTGALDNPRIDGDVTMTSGEVRLNNPRVIVTDVNARAALSRTSAHLLALDGTINGGTLHGAGTLEYVASQVPHLDARLTSAIKGMALEFPEGLRSELDSDLDLTVTGIGTPMPDGRVTGTVTLVRGAYREQLPLVTGLLNSLKARRATALFERSPLLDALALDVHVVTDDDLVVGNNVARLQIGADLRVIGTAAAPLISGRAELRKGGELFLGRNVYTLDLGTIEFSNPTAIDPDVNISATTRAGGESIEINMSGTPETLSADLKSTTNSSLGQADIASLLLTGRRLDELNAAQASAIGAQMLGNLSGDVLGFASRAVGLDMLRLGGVDTNTRRDPSAIATETDPTSRLTFGKSIGSKFDVTFSQSLRDGDAQTWILDYLPTKQIALRLVSDDDDLRTYELRHDVAFGGGAAKPASPLTIGPAPAPAAVLHVAAVTLRGELLLPEAQVRDRLRLGVGKRFDYSEWQDDRDRLQQLYRERGHLAAQIRTARRERPDGIELEYLIDAGPETKVEVTGTQLDPSVRREIDDAWADSAYDGFLIDEAHDIVRRAMASLGYLQATVKTAVRNEPGVRTLAIDVTTGSRTERTAVRVVIDDDSLREAVEAEIVTAGIESTAVANPAAVERTVNDFLRSRGYSRSRATAGAPVFEGSTAIVPVTIETGPRFVIGTITFSGAKAFGDAGLRETAALEPGTPFSDAVVEDARARVQSFYRREAFAMARVSTARKATDSQPAIDIAFAIEEGPRQVVGDVVVSGNRSADADVITRALGLEPGQPLRAEDWLRARRRVSETGLFRRVDATTEPSESPATGETVPMRVRITVEEWPALRLRYGFQVAEERPENDPNGRDLVPGLSADLTRRTLFGRPITTGGAVDYQRRERSGRAFLGAPTFFSAPLESSLSVEASREEFAAATLVTSRRRVSWEQRLRKGSRLSLSYAYGFERNHTFDTEAVPGSELGFDITINIARLTAAAAWDTRDDVADTTKGMLVSFTLEETPAILGSDIRFVRQLVQAYSFRPWRGVVLASAGRFGTVSPLGDQELIPSERFFTGGSRSVRGYLEDTIGPRNVFGDPAGGEALLVFNQEVRFPIHKWLRGVGFVDAGNVFAQPSQIRLGDLNASTGFGLRLATPVALFRVDYGYRMSGGSGVRGGRLIFGIGQTF